MIEVLNSGVQAQEFLSAFPAPESLLLPFLTPCGTVELFDHVAASRCGNHLMVDDVDEALNFSDLSAVTPQLIGVNDFWNVKFTQEPGEEQFGGLSIAMPLEQYVEHEAVLVHRPP